jgi:hypothetical protein
LNLAGAEGYSFQYLILVGFNDTFFPIRGHWQKKLGLGMPEI